MRVNIKENRPGANPGLHLKSITVESLRISAKLPLEDANYF